MDIFAKLVCIEISGLILLYAWFIARMTGAWSHPAVVYAAFWSVMTFLPLTVIFPVPVDPWAMAYIFGTVIAFSLPALCYDWRESISIAVLRRDEISGSYSHLTFVFFAMQTIAIVLIFVNMSIQGFTVSEFLATPIAAANRYLAARYEGTIHANMFSQSGVVLNYIAVAIGGLVIAEQRHRARIGLVFLFAFVPSILHMLVYADKGTLFQSAAYFFGGVLVMRVARGDLSLINKATLKVAAISLAILIPLLVLTMLSRTGEADKAARVVFYLKTYAFGHLYGFSDWFSHYYSDAVIGPYNDPVGPTWGFWTFLTVGHQILPDAIIPPGYFSEYFEIPGVIRTNIYTMFRGLIYDFGLIGSLVMMAILGVPASLGYNAMLRRELPALSQSFYIFVIGFIYSSYLFSLLAWNSVYVAAFGVTILMMSSNSLKEWSAMIATEHLQGEAEATEVAQSAE